MHYVQFPLLSCVKERCKKQAIRTLSILWSMYNKVSGDKVCACISLCVIVCVCICFICSSIHLHLQRNVLEFADSPVALHSIDGAARCHGTLVLEYMWDCCTQV